MRVRAEKILRAWMVVVCISILPIMVLQELQHTSTGLNTNSAAITRISKLEAANTELIRENKQAIADIEALQKGHCVDGQVLWDAGRALIVSLTKPIPELPNSTPSELRLRRTRNVFIEQQREDLFKTFGFGDSTTRPTCP